jgi:hypothetical protein
MEIFIHAVLSRPQGCPLRICRVLAAGIPDEVEFTTKPRQAQAMAACLAGSQQGPGGKRGTGTSDPA